MSALDMMTDADLHEPMSREDMDDFYRIFSAGIIHTGEQVRGEAIVRKLVRLIAIGQIDKIGFDAALDIISPNKAAKAYAEQTPRVRDPKAVAELDELIEALR